MKKLFVSFWIAVLILLPLIFKIFTAEAYFRDSNVTHYALDDFIIFGIKAGDVSNLSGSGCDLWSIYFNNTLVPGQESTVGVFGGSEGAIGVSASAINFLTGGVVNKVTLYSVNPNTFQPCAGFAPASPPYEYILEIGSPLFTLGDIPFPTPTPTPSPSNTPPGENIVVEPSSETTITYTEVVSSGQTTVASSSSGPETPSGFKLGNPPIYYDISTTAMFNSLVTVCINYDETTFQNEANAKLFHYEGGTWTNVTTSLDTINNIICGRVSSFSEFVLAENITLDYIAGEVKSFNLDPGIQQGLLAKLDAAKFAIERGQPKTAVNILGAFINLVRAQEGKALTIDQASLLIEDANALIQFLGG